MDKFTIGGLIKEGALLKINLSYLIAYLKDRLLS